MDGLGHHQSINGHQPYGMPPPNTKTTHRKTTSLISILPVHVGGATGSDTEGGILGSRLMSSKTYVRAYVRAFVKWDMSAFERGRPVLLLCQCSLSTNMESTTYNYIHTLSAAPSACVIELKMEPCRCWLVWAWFGSGRRGGVGRTINTETSMDAPCC